MAKKAKAKSKARKSAKTAKAAKRATTAKVAPTGARSPSRRARGAAGGARARVRMYRPGLGDCFLVFLPKEDGGDYKILIDCGVILGTSDAKARMQAIMGDIAEATGGVIDLLIGTHEHYDHLSGFVQAADEFGQIDVAEVWLGWTENPRDAKARSLVKERQALVAALRLAEPRLRLAGDGERAEEVQELLSFFGAAGSTADALDAVRKKSKNLHYKKPTDAPTTPEGTKARIFTLGPPIDTAMIRRYAPSKSNPETYEIARTATFAAAFETGAGGGFQPFDDRYALALDASRGEPFFQRRYWEASPPPTPEQTRGEVLDRFDNGRRRIDSAWLEASPEMALKLDSATNNTSLAIAIELDGGDVLLFAADAQVGNWLSWHDLEWEIEDDDKVTGPSLIERTILYKVGHHGSHNATLRERGLEMMQNLEIALLPVDKAMAMKKKWGKMPLPSLLEDLENRASKFVLRTDEEAPRGAGVGVDPNGLWWDIPV